MKKFWLVVLISVLLVLGALGLGYFLKVNLDIGSGNKDIAPMYSCKTNLDCVKTNGDCCGCNAGGTATAINKNFSKEYNLELKDKCGTTFCAQVISNDPSCFAEPKCISNTCVLDSGLIESEKRN